MYSSVWNFKEINNHASDSYFLLICFVIILFIFIEEACMTGVEYEINTFVKQKTKFFAKH